jgi:hypothetical protein
MSLIRINTIITFFVLYTITACGGSSNRSDKNSDIAPTIPPVTAQPISTGPQVSGASAIVSTDEKATNNSHQCHASNTENGGVYFSEISVQAGIEFTHKHVNGDGILGMSGGVAAGDFDGDGWVDLYTLGGDAGANKLYKNQHDGTFSDVTDFSALALSAKSSGPAFGDINGDGLLDLFVGAVGGDEAKLYLNQGNEKYLDITTSSGLVLPGNNFTGTWSDYDKDGDLDIFITHWTDDKNEYYAYFWRNNGDLTFTDVSFEAGIHKLGQQDKTFTPSFADIDNDGWQDLLLVADNNQTRVFHNNHDGSFKDITDQDVITDNAGMGSAIGDYDNDGDLDWFVSAISYKDGVEHFGWLTPGSRFYQNQGDGTFIDKTDETGVRHGYWGWASCFSDFDNDGFLDLFHVNGMAGEGIEAQFSYDPSRLFMSNGDGTFAEMAVDAGIDDRGMGRGIVCFDYDRDGDQDLFIANYGQAPKLYCNHGGPNNFINIKLIEKSSNSQALGARIYVKTSTMEQMRELRAGNNYVSQNPVEAHFGLSQSEDIEEIKVVWPDGEESVITQVAINRFITIERT